MLGCQWLICTSTANSLTSKQREPKYFLSTKKLKIIKQEIILFHKKNSDRYDFLRPFFKFIAILMTVASQIKDSSSCKVEQQPYIYL